MKKYTLLSFLLILLTTSCNDNPSSFEIPNDYTINYSFWGKFPYEITYLDENLNPESEIIQGVGSDFTYREITYTDKRGAHLWAEIYNIDNVDFNVSIIAKEGHRTLYHRDGKNNITINFTVD